MCEDGRVLTADVRFQGGEVTIGVNGCLPKDRITIHIKASTTASNYATFNSLLTHCIGFSVFFWPAINLIDFCIS